MFWTIFTLLNAVKLLFIPAYHSTDFEVHRNWLAITYSKPIKEWYFEETSEWTLDYPPFFGYFELFLSYFGKMFDEKMLVVNNLNYASSRTILFQRLSVIFSDFVFAIGIKNFLGCIKVEKKMLTYTAALTIGNIGLLMVDHIHFQYNGILFGILILSITEIYKNNYLRSAFWFTILLHMKHIFMYIAPVYTIFLFKFYCLTQRSSVKNFMLLILIVCAVTVVSFGPFWNQLLQILQRLFPFKRGLSHAYWAPNFWALYNFLDKTLVILFKIKTDDGASTTGGLVQSFNHVILPSVNPLATFFITIIILIPVVYKLSTIECKLKNQPIVFIQSIVLCASSSFLFGWHVHEKAILMIIIPLTLLNYLGEIHAELGFFIGIVGQYSLFPLLFTSELTLIKTFLFSSYIFLVIYGHSIMFNTKIFSKVEKMYVFGFAFLYTYENAIHEILNLDEKYPFLPLMFTSVYCTLGLFNFWIKFYVSFLFPKIKCKKLK